MIGYPRSVMRLGDIKWIGAHPENFSVGRVSNGTLFRPEAIVIHVMDGTLAGTDAWFNQRESGVSAHFGVNDYQTHQYVLDEDRAFHAGATAHPTNALAIGKYVGVNPNLWTIGIEHEGTATSPWSDALYRRSGELIAATARKWTIPVDRAHVFGHHEVYAVRPCPGACDLDRLVREALTASLRPR